MRYDCLVIGSGVSGMTSALIMAKKGFRSAIVEASPVTAPTIRGFVRKGLAFDTGFHYTGGLGDGEPLDIFFRYLGLSEKIEKYPFPKDGFDVFRCCEPTFEFSFPYGYVRILESLAEWFPQEIPAIDIYLEAIKNAYRSQPYINPDIDVHALNLSDVHGPTLKELLDSITDNTMLKSILSMHCVLHGATPEEVSVLGHARVVGSYYESVNGIEGGGQSLSQAYDDRLGELGVDIFCGTKAEEILLSQDGKIKGIRCDNGDTILCERCIATLHPAQLINIVPDSALRSGYRKRLAELEDTCSAIVVFAETSKPLSIIAERNLVLFPLPGFPATFASDPIERRPMFISRMRRAGRGSPSRSFAIICPERSITSESGKIWPLLSDTDAYRSCKREITGRIIAHVERWCPEFHGAFTTVECAVPMTFMRYTQSPRGAIYGVKHRIDQYNPSAATKIEGLYLAGQAICAPGVLGAAVSGFLACGNILGHETLLGELKACR